MVLVFQIQWSFLVNDNGFFVNLIFVGFGFVEVGWMRVMFFYVCWKFVIVVF